MRRAALLLVLVGLVAAGCGSDSGIKGPSASPDRNGTLDDASVELTPVATLEAPVALAPRAGSQSLYAVERAGRVRELRPPADPPASATDSDAPPDQLQVVETAVLDVSDRVNTDGEMGLLGLAFSPDGNTLYVDYNTSDRTTHLVRYAMEGDRADPGSATELLSVEQPFPNHKGGQLAFGPDGFLYFGLGDGGSGDDPGNRSPNTDLLLGKILRIDVAQPGDGGRPYGIPADNPYANGGGRPEIYLRGARNPWRFSFDRANGDLWISDVGQDTVEEIDHFAKGAGVGTDLGWSGYEGTRIDVEDRVRDNTVPPVFEYDHDKGGCSVIGGYVYRGERIPDLPGAYLFTDFCAPAIRALRLGADGKVADERALGVKVSEASSFGQDNAGELYVLSLEGQIFRLDPA